MAWARDHASNFSGRGEIFCSPSTEDVKNSSGNTEEINFKDQRQSFQ